MILENISVAAWRTPLILNEEEYRFKLAHYIDKYGLVNPKMVFSTSFDETGNGLFYSGLNILILVIHGFIRSEDRSNFVVAVKNCETDYGSCILNRSPSKKDQNGWDDYISVMAALWTLGLSGTTHKFLTEAKHWLWNLNNVEPGRLTAKSFFGRNPRFIAHYYYCCNMNPPMLIRILAWFQMYLGTFANPTHYNSWCLGVLYCIPQLHKKGISGWISKYYIKKMKEKVKEADFIFGKVVADKNHPFNFIESI